MVADSCPKLAMLSQPPLLRRSGLTWVQWIAQPGRTLWGPCHYNFSSGAIVETKLPLHGGWCWTWETFQFSDGLGVLGRNDASVRWGWPHKSCSPPIIVGLPECSFLSANTTGLKFRCYWVFLWLRIHENRCLKLHLWHHARPSSACPAPLHYPRDRWTKIPHWPHAVAVLAGHVRHGYPSPSCTRKLPGKHGTCTGPTHLGLWHTTIAEAMHSGLVQLVQSVKDLHKLHRYLILGLVNCAKFEFHPSIKQHLAQITRFFSDQGSSLHCLNRISNGAASAAQPSWMWRFGQQIGQTSKTAWKKSFGTWTLPLQL